jgi:hypothetical protein
MMKSLLQELGWAVVFSGLMLLVLFFGSSGPQFIYAMF